MSSTSTPNYLPPWTAFTCKSQTSYQLSNSVTDTFWYTVVFTPTSTDGTAWKVSVTAATDRKLRRQRAAGHARQPP